MTREQLKAIIGDSATDEMLKSILDINGADGEKHKTRISDLETKLKTATEQVEKLTADIKAFEGKDGELTALQAKIKEYEQAEQTRKTAEAEAIKHNNELERFTKAAVGKDGKPLVFSNDPSKDGAFARFQAALSDPKNTGKADIDIYTEATKDIPNLYASGVTVGNYTPNPNMGNQGLLTKDQISKMTPQEINKNWDTVKVSLANIKGD